MTHLRRKILQEIHNLEDTNCSICPLNNLSVNCTDE
ncbi:transposase, partial [Bacillus thuringiensis]|nr:transposase [Bacillus thuringiensis]